MVVKYRKVVEYCKVLKYRKSEGVLKYEKLKRARRLQHKSININTDTHSYQYNRHHHICMHSIGNRDQISEECGNKPAPAGKSCSITDLISEYRINTTQLHPLSRYCTQCQNQHVCKYSMSTHVQIDTRCQHMYR